MVVGTSGSKIDPNMPKFPQGLETLVNHRIVECFRLEEILKITYFQSPCYGQGETVSQKMPRGNSSFPIRFGLLMDRVFFSQHTTTTFSPLLIHHVFSVFCWRPSPSRPFAGISTLPMKPPLVAEMSALTSSQPEKSASLYRLLNWEKKRTLILLSKLILQINLS